MTPALSTTPIESLADYRKAVDEARQAAGAYYGDGTSHLDDAVYDALVSGIAQWEQSNPGQVRADSPVGKVGGGAAPAGDVAHTSPMLSLSKVHSPADLAKWDESLARRLGEPLRGGYAVELKLDGVSMAARYREGELRQLVLRGDHSRGEDVSHLIGSIDGLPRHLSWKATAEVRGEVVMTREQFVQANATRLAHNDKPFSNPRNATAGSIRAKNRPYSVGLTFYAFGAVELDAADFDLTVRTHEVVMSMIEGTGVQTTNATAAPLRVFATIGGVRERIEELAKLRDSLPFDIDGIVVKANDIGQQEAAGSATDHPHWATAYKLPPAQRQTKLLDVEWRVGRTGVIAPRARLEPVSVGGSVIEYATLHNPGFIERSGIQLGDTVMVFRSGDVIPRVEAPVVELRDGTQQPIVFPTACPKCGGPLNTAGERWERAKGPSCGVAAAILYAAGRDQLDLDGLGRVYVEKMISSDMVQDLADVFALTREQLAEATGSEKRADALLAVIERSKGQPLNRVFCALGIVRTGRTLSRRIARHFGTMEAIRAADAESLALVDGLPGANAPKIAAHVKAMASVIDRLAAAGVNMTEPDTGGGADKPLAGEVVVVTGSMSAALALSRTEVNELIERAGGRAASSVTKKTTLVVAGANAGSKLAKAAELGVAVTDEDSFAQRVAAFLG